MMANAFASPQEEYGFERLGPIVAYFLHDLEGVLERLAGQRGGRALFVSRGGLMIREALDAYRTAVGITPPVKEAPFYVSRFLAAKGAWRRAPERALAVLDREFGPATAETYLRRLDPSLEAPARSGRVYGSFSEFIGQDGPHQRRCREYLDAQATLFERYVSGLLDGCPLGVLIDTGWQGTIQSLITHTFPQREIWGVNFGRYGAGMDPAVAGRLFGLGFTGDVYDERRPLTAITHHRHLIEALFEPVGDSIEALQEAGGQVTPVGAERFSRDRLSPSEPALFSGVLRYLREVAGDQSYSALVRERDRAAKGLAEDILFPTRDTARLIGGFSRSVDFGRRDCVGVLVDPARSDVGPEDRIRAALWKQGQIALECRPAIARERQRMLLPKRGGALPAQPAEARAWDPAAPKVAIVMRTMDRIIFLSRAFESVARQTFDDYVLVVFNDGGDVAGVEAELAESRLDRRKVIVLDGLENRGMEAASNAAIRHVNSEYVVIHDDDDSWVQGFLARTVAYLDANRSAAGVVTHSSYVAEEISGDRVEVKSRVPYNAGLQVLQLGDLLAGNLFPPISFVFRRSHYDLVGGFNENLPVLGDWEFNIKVAARAEIGVIPEVLANYHYRQTLEGAYSNSIVGGADLHARYNAVVRQSLLNDEHLKHLAGAMAIAPLLRRVALAQPGVNRPADQSGSVSQQSAAPEPAAGNSFERTPGGVHRFAKLSESDVRLPYNLISKRRGLRVTWAPKNMCSTLKLSFAVAEGLIRKDQAAFFLSQPWRIHSWVEPLELRNLRDLEGLHSVAVIRDPASRLKSAVIEKGLFQGDAEFQRVVRPMLESHADNVPRAIEDMTIGDLLDALSGSEDEAIDPHWRSQVAFLSEDYETLLPMNQPDKVAAFFAKHDVELVTVDSHATSRTRGEPLSLSLSDGLMKARAAMGGQMRPIRFSDDLEGRIEEVVAERFAADLALWRSVSAAE